MSDVQTVPALLLHFTRNFQKPDAFLVREDAGGWVAVSAEEFLIRVEELSLGLRALGVAPQQRVAILSENRIEWAMADYAITALGAVTVPIYPTLPPPEVEHILRDSGASVLFVSTAHLFEKIVSIRGSLPSLNFVVAFDADVYQPGALRLEMVARIGRQAAFDHPRDFMHMAESVLPESIATIIYTSGTTGVPKGVMLTHRNLVSNVHATLAKLPIGPQDRELSFLPLAHVFQRHVDYAALHAGSTIAYTGNVATVADDFAVIRPTFAAGVPRFFERIHNRVWAEVARGSRVRQLIFRAAMNLAAGSPLRAAADRLVYRRIRERLGGRLRWLISGGAPLDPNVALFFERIGIPILEGYGMTEASPVITFSAPGEERIGKVGKPVGDVEIRIADDGEILVRGSNVMAGYYNMPEETARVLQDGWLHTGDIGRLDEHGYLEITDRKKDLIVTSTGKNIAPQLLEGRLRRIPYFDHVVVVGDRRHFISALVVPNLENLCALAREYGIPFDQPRDLLNRRDMYDIVMREVESHMRDLAEFEKVRKIAFVDREFSISDGDLTPTLKVRRGEIARKYQAVIEQLYAA